MTARQKNKTQPIKNLLICSEGELIGDGMMKLPFIWALRELFPQTHITWMTNREKTVFAGDLNLLVKGYLDTIWEKTAIGMQVSELWGNITKRHGLLSNHIFDGIINTSSRPLFSLITRRIPHQWHVSSAASWKLSDKSPSKGYRKPQRLIDRLMDLLAIVLGSSALKPNFSIDVPLSFQEQAASLLPKGPYVGLAPGAGGKHKCWPLDYFIAIANRLQAEGITPVVILGPAEREWQIPLESLLPKAQFPLAKTTETSPILTIALGQRMIANVSNDSGAGHLLAASGKPLISLFGPTPATKFTPNSDKVRILKAQDFGESSMAYIPIDEVWKTLDNVCKKEVS